LAATASCSTPTSSSTVHSTATATLSDIQKLVTLFDLADSRQTVSTAVADVWHTPGVVQGGAAAAAAAAASTTSTTTGTTMEPADVPAPGSLHGALPLSPRRQQHCGDTRLHRSTSGTSSVYHSVESAVELAAASAGSSHGRLSRGELQHAAERVAAARAAAPASPVDIPSDSSSSRMVPHDAASSSSAEVYTASSSNTPFAVERCGCPTAQTAGSINNRGRTSTRRSLDWSPTAADCAPRTASSTLTPAAVQVKPPPQQQQQPSAVSECYSDALSKFCSPSAATGAHHHQQQRQHESHKATWQRDLTPEEPFVHAAAAAEGSTSTQNSTTAYHTAGSQYQ
jgi:hypothetical protein